MDDPCLFPLLGTSAGLVEPEDGGLGPALVGLEYARADGLQSERRAAANRLKPSRISYVSSRRQATRGVNCP